VSDPQADRPVRPETSSTASRRRRTSANAPADDVLAEAWRALYASAIRYRDAAPWRWLEDCDIVGVRDPHTGETAWCAALGAAEEVFGLLAYRGAEGYHVHDLTQRGRLEADDAPFVQKALLLEFTDRSELDPDELARLRALGLSFRGPAAWPRAESHEPGWAPAPPDLPGVRLLTQAIEQALDVFLRAETDPSLVEPDTDGRLLVRTARPASAGTAADGSPAPTAQAEALCWSDSREAPPPPPPPDPPPHLNDLVLRRLRESRASAATLEFSALYTFARITDRGPRPYFAIAALLVDGASGMILDATVEGPPLTAQRLSDVVLAALGKLGARPARIHVKTERARAALQPLADALGIELRRVRHLPALEEAAGEIVATLERG
jgi:hypothetical protein